MVNDVSANKNIYFSGKGRGFRAEYGGKSARIIYIILDMIVLNS